MTTETFRGFDELVVNGKVCGHVYFRVSLHIAAHIGIHFTAQ
jgi:hypothetical protein